MHLIVGLGNPGRSYAQTRHNAGFMAVDFIAKANDIPVKIKKNHTLVGKGHIKRKAILLAKPQTFMNLSGLAVQGLLAGLRLPVSNLLVIQDDVDLPFGKVKIVSKGGSGGHKGIQSIQEALGTSAFIRIKVGIGRPPEGVEMEDFVLTLFPSEEKKQIPAIMEQVSEALELIFIDGLETAMNKIHKR